jgi:hypothetical protein
MPRYMIQSSHDPDPASCLRVIEAFMYAGSHYLTNTEWGCKDGQHTGWLIVEANDDVAARLMVPPVIRKTATLVKLTRFSPEQVIGMHQQALAAQKPSS